MLAREAGPALGRPVSSLSVLGATAGTWMLRRPRVPSSFRGLLSSRVASEDSVCSHLIEEDHTFQRRWETCSETPAGQSGLHWDLALWLPLGLFAERPVAAQMCVRVSPESPGGLLRHQGSQDAVAGPSATFTDQGFLRGLQK